MGSKMNTNIFEKIYDYPSITKEEMEQLKNAHEKIVFEKNIFLLKEKQMANEYYLLESGLMRSFIINNDGEDITTGFFSAVDIVIEVSSLFQRIPTLENIQTVTDCVCWKIDFDIFQSLYHSIDSFAEWGRGWLSSSHFYYKQRFIDYITMSATDRYLELIEKKPQVIQLVPLKNIASYLGVTDSSLSRIRKEIVKK